MKRLIIDSKGFTLVELLVAIAILSLVLMAISTTFISQRRSGLTQEDVSEAQQSARIGLETLVKDIRRAGMMVNKSISPIQTANNFDIAITIGIIDERYATIVSSPDSPLTEDGYMYGLNPIRFTVNNARDFEGQSGVNVRVIRTADGMQVGETKGAQDLCYTVTYLDASTLRLDYFSGTIPAGGIGEVNFMPGDTIVRYDCNTPWPLNIRYYISPNPAGPTLGTAVPRNLVRHIDANTNGIVDVGEAEEVIITNLIVTDDNSDGVADDTDGNGLPDNLFTYLDDTGSLEADTSMVTSVSIDVTTATTRNTALLNNQSRKRRLMSVERIRSKFF